MSILDKYKLYDFTPENYNGNTVLHVMSCITCPKISIMILAEESYLKWKKEVYAQQAFPYLSAEQREMIINGMHPECYDKLFPE